MAVAPERKWGHLSGAREAPEKFLVVPLHFLKCPLKWRGTIHDVATKVGDYNKTGVCPGPSLKPSLNI